MKEILSQLWGSGKRRDGKLFLSVRALFQMRELHLNEKTIENVFRNGTNITTRVQNYGVYSISISFYWSERKKEWVISGVRKYDNRH